MNLKDIANLLNDEKTLYTQQGGQDIAVNEGVYIMEKNNTIYTGKLQNNNLDDLIRESSEPQQLIDVNEVARRLGVTRQNVTMHVKNKNFKFVPKPLFYYENKSYTKYFWVAEQFE
ncbi:TPA: hypothetical protein PE957_002613 [Staphylococcus aureus]|nr:hypothetical protein [Staphylococcus aureus]HDG0457454.1 hypothetical protein [Staphylococcus aureus]